MGSSLTGNKIKDTYKSLIKISDTTEAGSSAKQLSDGDGNDLGLYVDTDGVFGVGSPASFTLDVSSANDGVALPVGTTANRPTGSAGIIRYNSTLGKLEYYDTAFKQIASENYVSTAIDNLIDSSPGTLDTLNEIAAALNDDPDFHTTITALINDKEDTITGAATTITDTDLTADKAVVSNGSGKIAVSVVTSTELGYLSGTTSAVQTQIDSKQDELTAGTGIDITGATISADLSGLVDTGAIQSDAVTAPKIAQFDDNLSAAVAGTIMISDGTDFTDVAMSGDVTITSAGVTTIGADKIDGSNIVDDSIDSEHYVDGSIDTAHIGDNQVTAAKVEDNIQLEGTESVGIPAGTTAQRPSSPAAGMFRYNTTDGQFEGYTNAWGALAGGGGGGGATTIVTENFSGDNSNATFDLANTIASEDNVQIYIDGVYQSKSNYSTSGNTITFTSAPPTGTNNIEVTHFVAIGGTPSVEVDTFNGDGTTGPFTLTTEPATKNNLQVYIDGVYQAKSNYSVTTTDLTFTDNTPTGTNNIEVTHIKLS